MKPRTKQQIFDEIAQQYKPIDINLSSNILTRVREERVNRMKSKFAFSAILTTAVILGILFTIPGVATAMKRVLGYIPNVGLVENDTPLRVLKETVQIEQEGTTITVTHGVVDSQQTIIVYQVENLPDFSAPVDNQVSDVCHTQPELKLPDGGRLFGQVDAGNTWLSGYNKRMIFPVLPIELNTVNLVFSCLEQSVISPAWSELEIKLDFVQLSSDTLSSELIDLPTPDPALTQSDPGVQTDESDIRLIISRYAKTDDNVVLVGVLESLSGKNKIETIDIDAVHLVDSSGKEISLVEDTTLANPLDEAPNEALHNWAYLTAARFTPGQATLSVDSAWIRYADTALLTFDVGDDPQPGQVFPINQTLVVAGREILIQSAEINATSDGISFTLTKPDDVSTVVLMDFDHPLLGGGGGPDDYGFSYRDGIPTGKINVTLASISVNIAGGWKTTVDLPDMPNSSAPTEMAPACLTKTTWEEALNHPKTLPEGLGGMLAMSSPLPPDYYYRVMTTNLDGTDHQVLALGSDVSLSPDSRQIIYSGDFYSSQPGLQLMDLESGLVTPLANTQKNDGDPIWSPDGTMIAFTRGPASGLRGAAGPHSIFIAKPDGTQQVPVVADGEANNVMAWFADGQRLLYTVAGPGGATVNSINISTMEVVHLSETNYIHSNIALTPDENRAAFEIMLPGENYGIQISNLDGSNPYLIVDAAPIVVTHPRWSPNGDWLVVSVYDEQRFPDTSVLALVEIDTCQIVPLTSLAGSVSTWNP
jgi:Tol biopolymer transport system component